MFVFSFGTRLSFTKYIKLSHSIEINSRLLTVRSRIKIRHTKKKSRVTCEFPSTFVRLKIV